MGEPQQLTINLPTYVIHTAQKLLQNGYQTYLVGGALRDSLLNKSPDDFDLATDALPSQVKTVFPDALEVGAAFGTIVVPVYNPIKERYHQIEITTFRHESDYQDKRHPSTVKFVTNIHEDLKRRDFTINAMALDLSPLKNTQIPKDAPPHTPISVTLPLTDPFGGYQDLQNKTIRAVGNPIERFEEDPLRAFRACRFKAQLEFKIEPNTLRAIPQILHLVQYISKERLQSELKKLLLQADRPSIGLECMRKTGLLRFLIPELIECVGVEQPKGHAHDVYWHLLYSTDKAPKKLEIRLAALLHDIAKPRTKLPNGHFYGHDQLSAQMAEKILKRLRFSNKVIKHVTTLIKWHMFYYPNYLEYVKFEAPPSKWSDAAVRRFIQRVGLEYIDDLFALRIADATSNPKAQDPYPEINALKEHIQKVLEQDAALKRTDLKINGKDLIEHLNLKPGPIIGQILDFLLEQVIEDPKLNKKETLLKLAQEFINSRNQSAKPAKRRKR